MLKIYDAILQESTESEAIEYARGYVWAECETQEHEQYAHSKYITTIEGVGVYYDYGANYYYFTDES